MVAVGGTPEAAEALEQAAAEVESASADPDSVVVRVTTIAEACVSLIRAPGSSVHRFINRHPLPGRIAG